MKLRVTKCTDNIKVDAIVGNIDVSDNQGKEVVLNVTTDVVNAEKQFTTDSNSVNQLLRQTD